MVNMLEDDALREVFSDMAADNWLDRPNAYCLLTSHVLPLP